jgi:hypothetical protein
MDLTVPELEKAL